ncbi:hypothetical protein HTVC028P_gp14 [Pelagibacter phage HTVC028P]|jgi:hypothetical protein|nr:hypothetical protein HTVC028P_gp14 [Pelagibacter phage HTVC028P]|tara:strand:- start:24 stop:302 length:279 start_codon:yes stop_codon:yes gene_type:complete
MRKKRESYCSMSKEQFLDPSTGPFKRLDDTAWYIKNRDGKPCYFLNMHTKYQQMPDACFKATAERSPDIDVNVINRDIAKFMEDQNEKKHSR